MKITTLFFLSLLFLACGDTPDAPDDTLTEDVSDAAAETGMPDAALQAETTSFLQTTVQAVQSAGGDITALSPESAANNINGWITKLSEFEGTDAVVDDLAALKKEFMIGGELDGPRISSILGSMADNTRELSDRAPGLSALADALQAGSDKLAGK